MSVVTETHFMGSSVPYETCERRFASTSRSGKTTWYFAQSNTNISLPPAVHQAETGHLYVHLNCSMHTHQYWMFGTKNEWQSVSKGSEYPLNHDQVLSIYGNGEPSWVTWSSISTTQSWKEWKIWERSVHAWSVLVLVLVNMPVLSPDSFCHMWCMIWYTAVDLLTRPSPTKAEGERGNRVESAVVETASTTQSMHVYILLSCPPTKTQIQRQYVDFCIAMTCTYTLTTSCSLMRASFITNFCLPDLRLLDWSQHHLGEPVLMYKHHCRSPKYPQLFLSTEGIFKFLGWFNCLGLVVQKIVW